jgi:flagellar biosynthesis protein FliQ
VGSLLNEEGYKMTEEMVLSIGSETIKMIIYLAGPLLGAAMTIGIVISILQAVTQINEATLTFIPKMIAVILVLVVFAPWMMDIFQNYASSVFGQAGEWVR